MINISGIAVKDKYDILKAAEILEKIGIKIFSSEKKKTECLTWDDVDDNYLMQNEDGSWRIQSHLMTANFTIESLNEYVNKLLENNPTIKKDIETLLYLKEKLKKELVDVDDRIENENKRINKIINQDK